MFAVRLLQTKGQAQRCILGNGGAIPCRVRGALPRPVQGRESPCTEAVSQGLSNGRQLRHQANGKEGNTCGAFMLAWAGGWYSGVSMLIFWAAIVGLVVWGINRASRRDDRNQAYSHVEIAKRRLARGEITRDDYEELIKTLRD